MARFTKEEDEIITKLYPRGTQEEILKLLPTRKWRNILGRAGLLNISRDLTYIHLQRVKEGDWSEQEDKILSKFYSSDTKELLLERLPNRTWSGIKCRAQKLDVQFWTPPLPGDVFNYWTIISVNKLLTICECLGCGKTKKVSVYDVVEGRTKSCGCQRVKLQKKTSLERYGVEHYAQTKEYQTRRRETCVENFGVDHNFRVKEIRQSANKVARETMLERYGVDHSSKMEKNRFKLRNFVDKHPNCQRTSAPEKEILTWIQGFYPDTKRYRKDGNELDIYIPELKIGIEYNGLYWHSELNKENDYHLKKTNYFKKHGIRTIHIFEHEWKDNEEQVKSFLQSAIKKNSNRIGARKCQFEWTDLQKDKKEVAEFLDSYHIQGRCTFKHAVKVTHEGQLIGVATFGRHHRNSTTWVLSRFCTKQDYTIQGGLAKISKLASGKLQEDMISWAHYRISDGNGYEKAGWEFEELMQPDYFYHKGLKVIAKQARQKKRVGTPKGMTERVHAKLDGLSRVYDCGKIRFVYKYK